MDPLNTHSPASLYQAFAPAEAKRLADRLEVHHTPCRHVAAWEKQRNSAHAKITWQSKPTWLASS